AMTPYRSSIGDADGSIMPVIITAHIAQSRSKCDTSHRGVIIHALAPGIGPYMSRAITTIHTHDTSGSRSRSTTTGVRSYRNADSRIVGGRSPGVAGSAIDQSIYRTELRCSRNVRLARLRDSRGHEGHLPEMLAAQP